MTTLDALRRLRSVEVMPAEHSHDPPRVDLWWRVAAVRAIVDGVTA